MSKNSSEEIHTLAAAYALGALDQNEAIAFEAHLREGCLNCEEELSKYGAVIEGLSLLTSAVEPPPRIREKLLARLHHGESNDSVGNADEQRQRETTSDGMLFVRASEGQWRKAGEGVFIKRLFKDNVSKTVSLLIRLMPGSVIPPHRHSGVEQCLVLEGDFHIGDEEFGPGDYQCALPGSIHESIYTVGGATVLIVAPADYELSI